MKLIKWQFNHKLTSLMKNPKFIWGSSALLGGLAYFKIWLPLTNLGIPCPFYKVTGHFCPGCGMTRAISSLLQGDIKQAWQFNMLLFIVPVAFSVYFILRKLNFKKHAEVVLIITVIVAIAFGILRNLPAFHFLAPIEIK